jgi:hypothetical protein
MQKRSLNLRKNNNLIIFSEARGIDLIGKLLGTRGDIPFFDIKGWMKSGNKGQVKIGTNFREEKVQRREG